MNRVLARWRSLAFLPGRPESRLPPLRVDGVVVAHEPIRLRAWKGWGGTPSGHEHRTEARLARSGVVQRAVSI